MSKLSRRLGLWGGAAAIAAGGFAFMASNDFSGHPAAGGGSVTESGYTISGVSQVTCGTNTPNICYLNFDAKPAKTTAPTVSYAYIRFDGTGPWIGCSVTTTYNGPNNRYVRCTLRGAPETPQQAKDVTFDTVA